MLSRHVISLYGRRCLLPFDALRHAPHGKWHQSTSWRCFATSQQHAAKRVTKRQIKELVQGPIAGESLPLPLSDKSELRQETMLEGVQNNMSKFANCVLLTKVGNFYELYYDHADVYAPQLGLRVATKGKDGVSMAGFQLQYLDKYLKRLVQELDKHVAICEEFPVYVQGKLQTPIPRRVTRVVTPGTLLDEEFLDLDKNNFLLSIYREDRSMALAKPSQHDGLVDVASFGLAWLDISTGEFYVQTTDRASLPSALMRVGASEVVLSQSISAVLRDEIALSIGLATDRIVVSPTPVEGAIDDSWTHRLDRPLTTSERSELSPSEVAASRILFEYTDKHLLEMKIKPQPPQRKEQLDTMAIDRSSIRGLELVKTARDGLLKGSLFHTIQKTVTRSGSRLLRERLLYPSISQLEIQYRLDLVQAFAVAQDLHHAVVAHLRQIYDVVRIAQKLSLNRGDADEMLCLANTFLQMKDLVDLLKPHAAVQEVPGPALAKLTSRFVEEGPMKMSKQIKDSIDEQGVSNWSMQGRDTGSDGEADMGVASTEVMDAPDSIEEQTEASLVKNGQGNVADDFSAVMRRGASPELEKMHTDLDLLWNQRTVLQESLRQQLGASKLTLKYDPRYGHVCQSPRAKGLTPEAINDIGATLVGNLKTVKTFYLSDWTSLGREINGLKFEIRQEEQRIFESLRALVVDNLVSLRQNAAVMAEIDVATSFANLAVDDGWVRPIISTKPIHNIIGGRHPTVKVGLQEKGQSFVSNDLNLDRKARAWLITGPNMAGKSTFLRQNALITILAQMGCYVPAEYAEIGIVDKIFSRIGAADDLFRNESTFMVEMLETASILRDATERSFVIMDEVGRGTAPEDGAAVAFASLHHLYHTNKCRTLFATHFHDLADQTAQWPHLAQHCTDLYEDDKGSFTFIHRLRPGVNRNSHALRVAQMAGLPRAALVVAKEALGHMSQSEKQK